MGIFAGFFGDRVRAQIENCRSGVSRTLCVFLAERYLQQHHGDEAIGLAVAVTNTLFGLPPTNEAGRNFVTTHEPLVEAALRDITNEPRICHIVSVFTHVLGNVAGNSGAFSAKTLESAVRLRQLGILLPVEQVQIPASPEELVRQAREFEQWVIENSQGDRDAPTSPVVFLLSYDFCYQGLPKILFSNPTSVISALQTDALATLQKYMSGFLDDYVRRTPEAHPHIPKNFGARFSADVRQVNGSLNVVLVSYPTPPNRPAELQAGKPILAPYFSAIAYNPSFPAMFHCFVLGQRPGGGTTLRSVSGENSHGNCGAGCRPDVEEFLDLILLVEREGIEAARKRYPQA